MNLIIATTGHANKYLPSKNSEEHQWYLSVKENLEIKLLELRPTKLITGCNIGWDTLVTESGFKLGIPVHGYIAYKNQEKDWSDNNKIRYYKIMEKLEGIYICCSKYHKSCFFERNELMVRSSDKLFALWNLDLTFGGTYHTICYANELNKEVINFWR